jgi:hypothetical protein
MNEGLRSKIAKNTEGVLNFTSNYITNQKQILMKNIYIILLILLTYSYTYAQKNEHINRNSISIGGSLLVLPDNYTNKPLFGWEMNYLNALNTRNCIGVNLQYYTQSEGIPRFTIYNLKAEFRRYFGAKPLDGVYLALNFGLEDITTSQASPGGVLFDLPSRKNIGSGLGLGINPSFGKHFSGYLKGGIGIIFNDNSLRLNFGGGISYLF